MKLRSVALAVGCLLLARSGAAGEIVVPPADEPDDSSNPYAVIGIRNIFHLNPEPLPPPPEPPKVELPVVKISGLFRVGQKTKAMFWAQSKAKKEPELFSLHEGEKQDFLELVKIDYDKGEVQVVNSGTQMTLTIKDDSYGGSGNKQTAANNPGPRPPGFPPRMPFPSPGFHPGGTPPGGPGANTPFGFPVRQRRTPLPQ